MKVTLIQATPNPIQTIANIASICYQSSPKDAKELVNKLYLSGHHSVFEHIYFTWKIEGISRACSHQLVRHRICSFTQQSQRYTDKDLNFVMPLFAMEMDIEDYSNAIGNAYKTYENLKGLNSKEDARYILPNATMTSLYLSCNLRELIHICNERLCNRAQWEIRNLVKEMINLIDIDLQFMLVPKCQSKLMLCNNPCDKKLQ